MTPLALVPKSDYEWENEIESEREQAKRTNDANVALSWAEKVYMYVSISLEELGRDQQDNVTGGRPATPDFERGLREDCKWIVEKFVRAKNPKAVSSSSEWNLANFGRFICVGYGLTMATLGIRMIDMKRIMPTPWQRSKATSELNIVLGKCTSPWHAGHLTKGTRMSRT